MEVFPPFLQLSSMLFSTASYMPTYTHMQELFQRKSPGKDLLDNRLSGLPT